MSATSVLFAILIDDCSFIVPAALVSFSSGEPADSSRSNPPYITADGAYVINLIKNEDFGVRHYDEPGGVLVLLPEEVVYLARRRGLIVVRRNWHNEGPLPVDAGGASISANIVDISKIWSRLCAKDGMFKYRYKVFEHFRTQGFVVRPGLQYGADWVLYRGSPSSVHSEMCLRVVPPETVLPSLNLTWSTLGNLTRIAPDVMKLMILCLLVHRHGSTSRGGGDGAADSREISLDIDDLDVRPVVCSTRRHVVQSRSEYGSARRSQAAYQRAARRNRRGAAAPMAGSAGRPARYIPASGTAEGASGLCSTPGSTSSNTLGGSATSRSVLGEGGSCCGGDGDTEDCASKVDSKRAKCCEG